MTARLVLVCQGATAATQAARFPTGGEALLTRDIEALPRLRAGLGWWTTATTSPSRAARDTAGALAAATEVEPALADCAYGAWTGHTIETIAAAEPDAFARWLDDATAAPPGGESLAAMLARVRAWLGRDLSTPGNHLVVVPPSVVRALVVTALDLPSPMVWRLDVEPLAVSRLSRQGERWRLASLNASK